LQALLFLAGVSLSAMPLAADDQPATAKPAPAKADAAEVKTLIDQLKTGKYEERNEATKKLMSAGNAAIAAVAKAALTDDLELGARCVDVLKQYLENGDTAAKTAARKALAELQTSKHASVAKWAGEALRNGRIGANRGFNRNGIIINGVGRFGGRPGAVGFRRSAKAVDNGKTIEITETIMPGNRQLIVKVTEKVNGKDKTTEYKGTTPLDLRRKNKEAYDLYRKHIRGAKLEIVGANNAAIPVQVGGIAGGAAGGVRVNSRTVNGQRTTTVTEGNGRRIVMEDNNEKDITVTITETVNGKQKKTEVKAKDLGDLKKKNAEAAKFYEKYSNFGRIRVGRAIGRFGGGLPVPRAVPALPAVPVQPAPRNNRIDSRKEIEKAKGRLQATIDKLQKLAAAGKADPKDLRKVAAEIKAARQDLERASRNLEP
jgi:hypothetical protein